jgi:hypothetical protein
MAKVAAKKVTKTAVKKQPALSPEKQVASFLAKFDPAMEKLIRSIRAALRRRFPTAIELVYDNYNFFVIGYSPTPRPSDYIVSLAANSKGVGLSFNHGATLPDPHKLLLGSGKQNRFIRMPNAAELAKPEVEALLAAAVAQASAPLPGGTRGETVIRAIAAKQRPRR